MCIRDRYGIVLAGWSSGSTYPLLGGLRSTAQVISYEIAMGLCFAAVFLLSSTMSTSEIIGSQHHHWYILLLLPSFIIYAISMVGETNRAPFDLPEAEGELVGGFHTEYSSLKFAMFMLAEYVNMTTVAALATTLYLGGWMAPWPLSLIPGANSGWLPVLWFVAKVWVFLFVFIWLRTTLPRLRYDQFMGLGWRVPIPASMSWVMIVALIRAATLRARDLARTLLPVGAGVLAAVAVVGGITRAMRAPRDAVAAARPTGPVLDGAYPVPPLPPGASAGGPAGTPATEVTHA